MTNTKLGTYIAVGGLIATILTHFGIILSPEQVGTFITDTAKFIGDAAVIWGVIHQYFITKKVVGVAKSLGAVNLK